MKDINEMTTNNPYPVMGSQYGLALYTSISLSVENMELSEYDELSIGEYIDAFLLKSSKTIAYGGYGEKRDFYLKSPLFQSETDPRCIHLGIDVWVPAQTPVYCPIDGTIHSKANNDAYLDYGYTVILQHEQEGSSFYSLYGHLSATGYDTLTIGQSVSKGEPFAYVGDPDQNGGWATHLHFQIINNIGNNLGDYPGVASVANAESMLANSPNPIEYIIPIE